MSIKVFGIKNCNTMKKTFQLMDENGVSYEFVDYKKNKPSVSLLTEFSKSVGLDQLINKKGTTYRKLSDEQKAALETKETAFPLMAENSSMIKRPIIQISEGDLILGYQEEEIIKKCKVHKDN